jgi:hypothetical protein
MNEPFQVRWDGEWFRVLCNDMKHDGFYCTRSMAQDKADELNNAYRLGREFERRKAEQQRNEKEN